MTSEIDIYQGPAVLQIEEATGPDGEIRPCRTSKLPPPLLEQSAAMFFASEQGAIVLDRRWEAYMHLLHAPAHRLDQALQEAQASSGALTPSSTGKEISVNGIVFKNEDEVTHYLEGIAPAVLNERRRHLRATARRAQEMISDLHILHQARANGAAPDHILTMDDVRMAVLTQFTGQRALNQLAHTRKGVEEVIAELMQKGPKNVEADPLAFSMKQIGEMCALMQKELEELSRLLTSLEQNNTEAIPPSEQSHVSSLADQAREVFRPFISENHVITATQIQQLTALLNKVVTYNRDTTGRAIEAVAAQVATLSKGGHHAEAAEYLRAVQFDDVVPEFERVARALDYKTGMGAAVLLYSQTHIATVLRHAPPHLLARVIRESGLPEVESLLSLVSPGSDALQLARK